MLTQDVVISFTGQGIWSRWWQEATVFKLSN